MSAINKYIEMHVTDDTLDIHNALQRFSQVMDDHEKSSRRLQNYIAHTPEARSDAFQSYVINIIDMLCERANNAADNQSHISITRSRLSSRYAGYRIREAISLESYSTNPEIATALYKALNVKRLNTELDAQKRDIQNSGYINAADEIAKYLGLTTRHSDNVELLNKKGMVGIEMSQYGHKWERERQLAEQIKYGNTMEAETGISGYVEALESALSELGTLDGYDAVLPSRTTIKSNSVEIVFFSQKLKMYFTPQCFDSIYAFLSEFAEVPLPGISK